MGTPCYQYRKHCAKNFTSNMVCYQERFVGRYNDWLKCLETYGVLIAMISANIPKPAVSMIYLCLNHQLTLMIQLPDWTNLALHRQPLRVSDPEPNSDQTSTYWLSIPYQYSVPLLLSSVLMGWLHLRLSTSLNSFATTMTVIGAT
jgi:hypothetical protein